jgi:hypothetical protein
MNKCRYFIVNPSTRYGVSTGLLVFVATSERGKPQISSFDWESISLKIINGLSTIFVIFFLHNYHITVDILNTIAFL